MVCRKANWLSWARAATTRIFHFRAGRPCSGARARHATPISRTCSYCRRGRIGWRRHLRDCWTIERAPGGGSERRGTAAKHGRTDIGGAGGPV